MHISIVANGFQPEYMYNLLNNMVQKADRVDFIGSSLYSKEKLDPRIVFYDLRGDQDEHASFIKKAGRVLNYYKKLIKYLITTKAKVIHVQWLRFHFVEGVLITLIMRAFGKKVVYTAHNTLPHHKDGIYYRVKFWMLYKVQNEIIVHTNYIKNQIIDYFEISPSKIHVVHHGVYNEKANSNISKLKARKLLGLAPSSTVILFFGKIVAYKGFDTLMKSMDILKDQADLAVLVAGKVSHDYKAEFEALVKQKQFTNYTFLLKYLSEEEVEQCFKAADVTVLPYKETSQSGVLFMSYSYGVPVIVPDIGGFPEDILLAKTGYLFEADNPDSLAKNILSFARDWKNMDPRQNEFIMEFAAQNYSWNTACEEIHEVYRATVGRQPVLETHQ